MSGLRHPKQVNQEERPPNPLRQLNNAVGGVISTVMAPIEMLDTGFANATHFIAQALPSFPAATLGSFAVGLPHAHIAHPPSGPAPIPPTPLPPVGSVLLGNCVQVLIGGLPAARCGDLGLSPTCCGLTSLFEIFTGSSKVFIGGARAARVLDVTWHCRASSDQSGRMTAAAMKAAAKSAMLGAMPGMALQAISAGADGLEAVETDDSAMGAALGMSAGLQAAQMANDLAAAVAGAMMGKDQPALPPTGTLGAIMVGVPNVLIGGFPMPSWMDIAKGLLKLVKGLKGRGRGKKGRQGFG